METENWIRSTQQQLHETGAGPRAAGVGCGRAAEIVGGRRQLRRRRRAGRRRGARGQVAELGGGLRRCGVERGREEGRLGRRRVGRRRRARGRRRDGGAGREGSKIGGGTVQDARDQEGGDAMRAGGGACGCVAEAQLWKRRVAEVVWEAGKGRPEQGGQRVEEAATATGRGGEMPRRTAAAAARREKKSPTALIPC